MRIFIESNSYEDIISDLESKLTGNKDKDERISTLIHYLKNGESHLKSGKSLKSLIETGINKLNKLAEEFKSKGGSVNIFYEEFIDIYGEYIAPALIMSGDYTLKRDSYGVYRLSASNKELRLGYLSKNIYGYRIRSYPYA